MPTAILIILSSFFSLWTAAFLMPGWFSSVLHDGLIIVEFSIMTLRSCMSPCKGPSSSVTRRAICSRSSVTESRKVLLRPYVRVMKVWFTLWHVTLAIKMNSRSYRSTASVRVLASSKLAG